MSVWIGSNVILRNERLPTPNGWGSFGRQLPMQRQLPKLLNFTTNIVDGVQVIGVHIYKIKSHTIKKVPMTHKSAN